MKKINNSINIYKAKQIGLFFLLAFLAYGSGRSLFESENVTEKYIGSTLIIVNSIMVLFIGAWLRKTLRQYNELVGNIYFLIRVFEAIALASITLNIIPIINVSNDLGYHLAMIVLGLGSIPMCTLLYKHEIAPKWLTMWGIAGYAIFSFGFFMELLGKNWSMYLIWLIIKGGKEQRITTR